PHRPASSHPPASPRAAAHRGQARPHLDHHARRNRPPRCRPPARHRCRPLNSRLENVMTYKAIDIIANVFTPAEFEAGQIATDDWFRSKTRQDPRYVRGIEIEEYIEKKDRAGIERSLLAAVRSGDMRIKGSVEVPYERVYELCQRY